MCILLTLRRFWPRQRVHGGRVLQHGHVGHVHGPGQLLPAGHAQRHDLAAGGHALDTPVDRLGAAHHAVHGVVPGAVGPGLVDNAPDRLQGVPVSVRLDRRVHVGHRDRGEEEQRFAECDQMTTATTIVRLAPNVYIQKQIVNIIRNETTFIQLACPRAGRVVRSSCLFFSIRYF